MAQRVVRHLGQRRRQAEATEYRNAWTTFANVEKSWAYRQDQLPSTHPIAADIPDLQAVEVNFDGITYAKGACVLKQLVGYVGQEEFLAGVRLYFRATRTATRRSTTCSAPSPRPPAATCRAGARSGCGRRGSTRSRRRSASVRTGRYTAFEVVQGGARPGAGELRTHRLAVGLYGDDGSGKLSGSTAWSWTSPATAPRCPSWSVSTRARWCWSTTTTSPTARCGSTSAR